MDTAKSKIRTVIFDLGGVIFADGSSKIDAILEKEKDYNPELIKRIIKSEKRRQAMKGEIEDTEFWDWVKTQLPPDYDIDYIRKAYYDSYQIDKAVIELAKQLKKQGFKLIIFSGNMRGRNEYLEQKYKFSNNFDDAVYSFKVGYTKPEPEFFEALIKSLDCDPTEAILIDDREDNLEFVKQKYDMNTALYTEGHIDDLAGQLRKLGMEVLIDYLK